MFLGVLSPPPILTTWTHSIRGRRTAWLPERLTTQAGVSGVPSSRAMTASTPIRLPCEDRDGDVTPLGPPLPQGRGGRELLTRMRSKAEGVPPRWTWPRMVTRVS